MSADFSLSYYWQIYNNIIRNSVQLTGVGVKDMIKGNGVVTQYVDGGSQDTVIHTNSQGHTYIMYSNSQALHGVGRFQLHLTALFQT